MSDLKLRLKVSFTSMVGYGEVYQGEVEDVLQGQFGGNIVTLTVLATDTVYSKLLSMHQKPAVLDISFSKERERVPYGIMPITGMVDEDKNAWIIEAIQVYN